MANKTLDEVIKGGGVVDPFGEREKQIYKINTITYIITVQEHSDSNPKVELRVIEEHKGGIEPKQRNHHAGDWANLNAITAVVMQTVVSDMQKHSKSYIELTQTLQAENIELKKKLGI